MRILKWLTAILGMLTLVACGGGGGDAGTSQFGTGNGSTGTGTGTGTGISGSGALSIVLSISKTTITVGSPATLTATVTTSAGTPAAGQVVNFSTVSGLGALSASSALTDTNGMASVQLSPASTTANGADLAVATLTTSATSAATAGAPSATIGFQSVAGSGPSAGTPTIGVQLSSTSVTSAAPVTLTATLRDANGAPVANQIVKFGTIDSLGTFNVLSALSDVGGKASVKLSPATTSTNGADLAVVTATINGTVVTGTAAFSVTSIGAPVVGVPAIALALSTTSVTTSTPATVTATVKDATGAGVAGQVVKFSTVDSLGTFDTTSALTNASGVANVTLSAKTAGVSGADQVVASTTVNGTALQASQGFRLTAPNVAIGKFESDIGTVVGLPPLSSYGQANLTLSLTGALVGTPVSVSVSSACVAKGKASLTPATISTTTGTATFTYRDLGCGATDSTDIVQASVVGTSATESLKVYLAFPAVASINFVSATPTTIYLKGSGYTETSSVIFRVLDSAGNGLPNRSVALEPSTLAGGLTLDGISDPTKYPLTKQSDSLGNVNVTINSGTVPTPVRVKATLSGLGISTVSSSLSIAVGLPSELNFSLSQQTINIEGFDIDGTPNVYSIIASDRLANPVPVGTAINFIAEAGQIEPSKFTALTNGLARASANFISSSPRPADGRVTVVAYALGEESFLDVNGNNIRDSGEQFQDLGNVYLDRLSDGVYNSATDQFIALSLPGVSASSACVIASSPLLAGDISIPSVPSTCDGVWGRAYVRRAIETVFSTSVARPLWFAPPSGLAGFNVVNAGTTTDTCQLSRTRDGFVSDDYSQNLPVVNNTTRYYAVSGGTTVYSLPTAGAISFLMADNNQVRLNPVAAGSTIAVTATAGLTASVAGGSPVPSTSTATFATIQYAFSSATSGTITVNITSPSGLTTSVPLSISTNALPGGAVACR